MAQRLILAALFGALVLSIGAAENPAVLIRTEKGDITVEIDLARAPVRILSVRRITS
jgi:hypothetical protein